MPLLLGRWSIFGWALAVAGCGVSVVEPVGAGVVSTGDAAQGTTDAPLDPLVQGLVAHWKLDEAGASDVVVDWSGRGHSGLTVGNAPPSPSIPPVRFRDLASRSFDGATQYVRVANYDDMNFSGETTLTAWVNIASLEPPCQYILGHGYCSKLPGEVVLRIGAPGCGPGGAAHFWAAGAWNLAEQSATAPISDADVNVWIHIAGIYDGQAWLIYRNGQEIGRQETKVGAMPVTSDWAIGARAPGVAPCLPITAERYFNGMIDDVRLYRRALTPSEILELSHQ